ncbi:MAG: hypothetical protein CFE43_09800 [Burkholderiales bacterium PBB3]|nr:MAG: hypothetical protein CFE43_09800 [Burkholderiales bacterium PBB3]
MQRRSLLSHCAATATAATLGSAASRTNAQPPATSPNALPAHVAEAIPGAIFSGATRMRFLGFDVYDAALWVAPGFKAAQYAQSALVLELTYLRSLNGRSIAQRSISEMRRAGEFTAAQEQRWLAAMETSFPDVKATDRITGVHNPAVGARFWFNGIARAPINEPDFSRLFFGIWLSPATSEPKLRTALLANAPA